MAQGKTTIKIGPSRSFQAAPPPLQQQCAPPQ
jgi:hypothetical protein